MQQSRGEPGTLVSTNKPVAEPRYHKSDLFVWLLYHASEAVIVVERVEMMALVDTESQISALTEGFCHSLKNLIGHVLHL